MYCMCDLIEYKVLVVDVLNGGKMQVSGDGRRRRVELFVLMLI